VVADMDRWSDGLGAAQVVLVEQTKAIKVLLHRLGGHQREESVNTVLRVVVGQRAKQELAKRATETVGIGVAHAVSITPGCEVGRCEIVGEEAVTTGEGNGVAQDSAADSVSGAQTGTWDKWLRLFGLETDVELEVLNIPIELLGGFPDFRIRIPFCEGSICCAKMLICVARPSTKYSRFNPRN